jgi:hypothetical protein
MLAEIKAKKEAKENAEADKQKQYEKKIAKAREQAMKNFAEIPDKPLNEQDSENGTGGKKVTKKFNDQNC